jgi:hypothetical protein
MVVEMTCIHGVVGHCEACAHPDYFCEHGVFGFEPCQPCETKFAALAFGCQIMGHDMVDNGSYAGPDSGAESFVCTYCGFQFEHTYY